MRVLHVSEAMGGGITSAILAMVEATPDLDHHLFSRPREAHDTGAELRTSFGTVQRMPGNPMLAVRALRRISRELFPDVVHAHSSFAGVLVRMAGLDRPRIVYSPHCFGFERRDISGLQRMLFRSVEHSLAPRTDVFLAVAPSEMELAARLGHRQIAYAPNRAMLTSSRRAAYRLPLRIVTTGRICRQKDWRYFLHLKRYVEDHLGIDATWQWLGGGDPDGERELSAAGVVVSGWIDRDQLVDRLARAQVYLHTAAWEAAPISILEAASLGLPLALRSIPPLESLGLPGRAGAMTGLAERIASLDDPATWARAQAESVAVTARHSLLRQGRHLRRAYALACGNTRESEEILAATSGAALVPAYPWNQESQSQPGPVTTGSQHRATAGAAR